MNIHMILMAKTFSEIASWDDFWSVVGTWALGVGKNILIAAIVLFICTKLIKKLIKIIGNGLHKTKMEPIVIKFLISIIKFALYIVLAIVVTSILGIPTTSFVAVLSTASLAIGLAIQGALSNFAGGVIILLFKPFKIGDYIREDSHGNEGTVVGIDLFYTKIKGFDNKYVTIPNGTLANSSLVNYTAEGKRRVDLSVGISYSSDIKKAKDVLTNLIAKEDAVLKDENNLVVVDSLDESAVTLGVKAWVNIGDYWDVKWDLTEKIKLELDANGIEIPFNQLSVHITN